jgi:cellobiose phosphorylase
VDSSHFGTFIEGGACFEATATPHRPWMNVHFSEFTSEEGPVEFLSHVSQYGDGPIVLRTPGGGVVNLVGFEGRALYLRDDDTNECFTPCGSILRTPVENLHVQYRAADTVIQSECLGLSVRQRFFVPQGWPLQVCSLFIENLTVQPKRLSVVDLALFILGSGRIVEVCPEMGGVFAHAYDSKGTDRWHKAFLCVLNDFYAATADREDFFGPALNRSMPQLLDGKDLGNLSCSAFYSLGAVQAKFPLPANGTKRLDFLMGYAPSRESVQALKMEWSPEKIDSLHAEVCRYFADMASAYQVDTGHADQDAVINHFVKKQHVAYLARKSGYRDNLQVCSAIDLCDPERSEAGLLTVLSHQYADGHAPHHFRPLSIKHCSDEPAWILMSVPLHVQETGDFGFLEKEIPFMDDKRPAPVWDHLLRAMRYLMEDLGPHGLCNLRDGDWNDGLSPRGYSGVRESVMVTEQLCYGLLHVAELAEHIGETTVVEEAWAAHRRFADRINAVAWDGAWYQRVLCDDGFIIGTQANEEGKIFMNAQSWAVLGEVAPPERAVQCMDSVEALLKLDIGYRVVWPPFSKFDERVGGSSTVIPGTIENGSCYNHASGFKAVADCHLGRAEQAWQTFRKVTSGNPDNPIERSQMEPFAYSNMFFADRHRYGRTLYAWNTGTGAWFAMLLLEHILGIRRDYEGLRIDPCLTKQVPLAEVTRTFRGAEYRIRLDNRNGRCTGTRRIIVDGSEITGSILPDFRQGLHEVEVRI